MRTCSDAAVHVTKSGRIIESLFIVVSLKGCRSLEYAIKLTAS